MSSSDAKDEVADAEPTPQTSSNNANNTATVNDDNEDRMGISVYMSTEHDGFSAVVKARYSDFVVHEVALDGTIARLTSLNSSTDVVDGKDDKSTKGDKEMKDAKVDDAEESKKRKHEGNNLDAKEPANKKPATAAEPSWTEMEASLCKLVGDEAGKRVIQFFQTDYQKQKAATPEAATESAATDNKIKKEEDATNTTTEKEQYYVALPPLPDKKTRTAVHQWLRSSPLMEMSIADTADDDKGNKVIRFWILRHERKMPNYGTFDRRGGRIPSKGHQGQGGAPRGPKPQGFLQFVLYKENIDTHTAVKQVTQRLGGGGRGGGRGGRGGRGGGRFQQVRVGYSGMKDKRGVTAQFCTLHQRRPDEIDWVNKPSKFDNGRSGGGNSSRGGVAVVRVGNFKYVTEELRLGTLKGNRFDVVLRNVQTANSSDDTVQDRATTKAIVSKSAEALKKNGFINYFGMQRFGKFHDTHLCGVALLQGDFEQIVEIIMRPKEGEQQHIADARRSWNQRFARLMPADEVTTENARKKAESDCASQVVRSFGRFMASEVALMECLSRYPLDYKRAFSCIGKTMRMMFMHAVQSLLWNKVTSFRIETMGREIVVGDLVFASDDTTSEVKHVTEEDIAAKKYSLVDVVVPLLGTKSLRPANELGKLFDSLMQEIGINADMFVKIQDRDLNCPGDYRKILCRPSDVDFTIVEYKDPVQPLLQTDLMALNGVPVLDDADEGEKPLLGMVVGFTLPSSAYATIALRELMKKPTSSEYQKGLSLFNI